jgi:hypothetical protein
MITLLTILTTLYKEKENLDWSVHEPITSLENVRISSEGLPVFTASADLPENIARQLAQQEPPIRIGYHDRV